MKVNEKLIVRLALSAAVLLAGAGVRQARAEEPTFGITVDYAGKYIWRGQRLVDDPVLQPAVSATAGNLTASVWGNMELTNINGNSGDFSEVDYSIDYSAELEGIEGVSWSVGAIYYDFPGTDAPDTAEIYGGLGFDMPLNPSVTLYRDIDEADGTYVAGSVSHSVEEIGRIGDELPVGLEVGASLGWGSGLYNKYYWAAEQSKLNDLALWVNFPVRAGEWTVGPTVRYVTLVSDDIRDSDVYGTASDFLVAGVSLRRTF